MQQHTHAASADDLARIMATGFPVLALPCQPTSAVISGPAPNTATRHRTDRTTRLMALGLKRRDLELRTARLKLLGRCKAASASEAELRAVVLQILQVGAA